MVGCGLIAERSHLPAIVNSARAEVATLVDRDRARAEEVRSRFGLTCQVVESSRDLAGGIDAAVVAVPNALHAEVSEGLLEQGIHVLCEKPLALSSADALRVCETAERKRLATQVLELMEWHANNPSQAGRRYLLALRAASRLRPQARTYLDFGSGIGTGALLFQRSGFDVSLADISADLLAFCRWRFDQRRLPVSFVDLETTELPSESFDVATCFDVLEHVTDPHAVVSRIHRALKPGGLLILRVSYVEGDDHPMHIIHNPLLPYSFEPLGFRYHFGAAPPLLQVLAKTEHPAGWTSRPTVAIGCRQIGREAFYIADYRRARQYFARSLGQDPFQADVLGYFAISSLPSRLIDALRAARRTLRARGAA